MTPIELMATLELFLKVKIDGRVFESSVPNIVFVEVLPTNPIPPVDPVPPEIPPVTVPDTKYVMVNVINWDPIGLNALPLSDASELTYFVHPVSANGTLRDVSDVHEKKFVADVHGAGKKATFSVGGGQGQDPLDITQAVTMNRMTFINNIAKHLTQYEYDGVTLDIEETKIDPQIMADFGNAVRVKFDSIKPGLIIGMYVQPYQLTTVMSKIEQAAKSLTWLSPMIYDFDNTVSSLKTLTLAWLPKVGGDKSKLLVGAAVNYDTTGLNQAEFAQVLEWINSEGLKGVGIWNNALFIQSTYRKFKRPFPPTASPPACRPAALPLGTGIRNVVIGISGGLGSTHTLIVAARAMDLLGLPRTHIKAYTMPGFATSTRTLNPARALMASIDCEAHELA